MKKGGKRALRNREGLSMSHTNQQKEFLSTLCSPNLVHRWYTRMSKRVVELARNIHNLERESAIVELNL